MLMPIFLPKPISFCFRGFWLLKEEIRALKEGSSQGSLGTLSVQKRELLGWKHLRSQIIGEGRLDEEGNE